MGRYGSADGKKSRRGIWDSIAIPVFVRLSIQLNYKQATSLAEYTTPNIYQEPIKMLFNNYLFRILYRLPMIIFAIALLMILGCSGSKIIQVHNVAFDECVPDSSLFDYVDQMKFLALKSEASKERDDKLKTIGEIERKLDEAKALLEDYRRKYGFGDCKRQH